MAIQSKSPIWNYWQPLVGVATFLVAGGIFYNKVVTMQQKQTEIEARQDRQFQLIQSMEKRISEIEKKEAYEDGLRDGKKQNNE